jgi:hypothetical protein
MSESNIPSNAIRNPDGPVSLNLSSLNLTDLKTEVDAGLETLLTALQVAQKLSGLFPTSNLASELSDGIQILTTIKTVVDKF